ncbi:hypothetical protein D0867_03736 [Hortaea werneckii]|uniref:Uncharacterized protein n=1 Tax=Hortaea werneckii TaxID=91943 RepID=A0A3M7A0F9_HORWE|nr:hypothetical protein D0867_03736 [Hortaea werneckii]RMY31619.1 hypothetical protein D0866_07173 [Hortaea werneckii]
MANGEDLGSHAKKRKRQGEESGEVVKRASASRSQRRRNRGAALGRPRKAPINPKPLQDDNDSEEDLSVALSHGSRGAGNTVGHGDAHVQDNVEREPPFKKQKSTDEGDSSTTLPAVILTSPTAAAPSANAIERTQFSRFGARLLGIEQAISLRTVTPTPPPVISAPRRFLQQMVNLLPSISQTIGWVAVQGTKGMIWVIDRVGPVLIFAVAGGIFFAVDLAKSFDGSEAHEALIRLMGRLFDLFYDDGKEEEDEEVDTTPAPSEPKRIEGTTASPQPAKCTCGGASSPSNSAERCAIHSSTFTGPQQQEKNGQLPTVLPAANISRREREHVRVQIAARHLLRTWSNDDRRHPALSPYLRNIPLPNDRPTIALQRPMIRNFQNRGRFRPISSWRNTSSPPISPVFWAPTLGTLRARQNAARRQLPMAPFQPSVSSRGPVFNGPSVNVAANFNHTLYPVRPQLPPPTQTISVYSVQALMNRPPQNNGGNVLYAYHNDPNAWDPSGLIMGLSHGPLPPPPPPSPPMSIQMGPLHFVDFNGHRFVFEWETPGSRDLVDFLAQAEREFHYSSASSFDRQKCIDLFNGKIQSLIHAAR